MKDQSKEIDPAVKQEAEQIKVQIENQRLKTIVKSDDLPQKPIDLKVLFRNSPGSRILSSDSRSNGNPREGDDGSADQDQGQFSGSHPPTGLANSFSQIIQRNRVIINQTPLGQSEQRPLLNPIFKKHRERNKMTREQLAQQEHLRQAQIQKQEAIDERYRRLTTSDFLCPKNRFQIEVEELAALSFSADILSEDALSEENRRLNLEDLEFNAEIFKSMDQVLRERYELIQLDESVLQSLQQNKSVQYGCEEGHTHSLVNDPKKQAMILGITRQITQKNAENLPYWLRKFKRENKILGQILLHLFLFFTCRWVPKIKNSLNFYIDSFKEHIGMTDNADIVSMDSEQIEEALMKKLTEQYCKSSLNLFELDSQIRRFCIRVFEHTLFDKFIILLIFFNSMFLGMMDYTWNEESQEKKPLGNKLVDNSENMFTFFFTMECIIKVIAKGLILENSCYLRDMWNWLDFTVVIAALLQNLQLVDNVSSLRTFRLFRPLRTLSAVPSMKILVSTLFKSFSQLSYIMILNMFFLLTFAMFGLQMWNGVIHYRCRQTPHPVDGDWRVVEGQTRVCGSFNQCEEGTYCGSLFETTLPNQNGVLIEYKLSPEVSQNLMRDTFIPQLNYGITRFDNIGYSYLTIFQCSTLEGWTKVMMMIQDGSNFETSTVFFCVLVVFCSFFLLKLTIAVMLSNFKNETMKNFDGILLEYEKNQVKIGTFKSVQSFFKKKLIVSRRKKVRHFIKSYITVDPGIPQDAVEDDDTRYKYKVCLFSWKIIQHPVFNAFILTLIVLNTIILATDQYPQSRVDLIGRTNMFFMVAFAIECVLKIIGLQWKDYKADNFNLFDLVIVISSIIELIMSESSAGVISALRAFRLFRLVKLIKSNYALSCLVDSILHTIGAMGNFLVLLAIVLYVFALLGMSYFSGQFKFDAKGYYDPVNGIVPRQNFDKFHSSFITVLQIMIGDDWNQIMYKAIVSSGSSSITYFVLLKLTADFILFNLFLAILLGNFEQASLMIRAKRAEILLAEYKSPKPTHLACKKDIEKDQDKQENSDDISHHFSEVDDEKPEITKEEEEAEKRKKIQNLFATLLQAKEKREKAEQEGQAVESVNLAEILKSQSAPNTRELKKKSLYDTSEKLNESNAATNKLQSKKVFQTNQAKVEAKHIQNILINNIKQNIELQIPSDQQDSLSADIDSQIVQSADYSPDTENQSITIRSPSTRNILIDRDLGVETIQEEHEQSVSLNEQVSQAGGPNITQTNSLNEGGDDEESKEDASNPPLKKTALSLFQDSLKQQFKLPNKIKPLEEEQKQESKLFRRNTKRSVKFSESPIKSIESDNDTFFKEDLGIQMAMPDVSPIFDLAQTPTLQIEIPIDSPDVIPNKSEQDEDVQQQAEKDQMAILGMPSHTKPHEYDHAIKLFNADREDEFIDYIYELNEKSESIKDSSFDSSVDLKRAVQSQIKLREKMLLKRQRSESMKSLEITSNQSSLQRQISAINVRTNKLVVPNQIENIRFDTDNDGPMSTTRNLLTQRQNTLQPKAQKLNDGDKCTSCVAHRPRNLLGQSIKSIGSNQEDSYSEIAFLDRHPEFQFIKDCFDSIWEYMSESSLFILHRDTQIRQWLIKLTTPQIFIDSKKQTQEAAKNIVNDEFDEYGDEAGNGPAQTFNEYQERQKNLKKALNAKDSDDDMISPMSQNLSLISFQQTGKFKIETDLVNLVVNKQKLITRLDQVIGLQGSQENLQEVFQKQFAEKLMKIENLLQQDQISMRLASICRAKLDEQREEFGQILASKQRKLKVQNNLTSLNMFLKKRFACLRWSLNDFFENFIYLSIFINMILLVMDSPQNDPKGSKAKFVVVSGEILAAIFFAEAILRIFALGFFECSIPGRKAYFQVGSNKIDFFISVVIEVVIFSMQRFDFLKSDNANDAKIAQTGRSLKGIRALRALKPLRLIFKNEGLNLAVMSLMTALPSVINGMMVCGLIVFIYAIIGISIFKGRFQHCVFPNIEDEEKFLSLVDNKSDCLQYGGLWQTKSQNFDNIFSAVGTLCQIITTEGWLDVMYSAIDSTGEGLQPKENYNQKMSLFFISFIITGNIFIIKLFVGIMIDRFNRLKDQMRGYNLMTRDQKDWIQLEQQMIGLVVEPYREPPEEDIQLMVYNLVQKKEFENFIYFCIFASTCIMASNYYLIPKTQLIILKSVDNFLTGIYNFEAVLKIFAFRQDYFANKWNRFDFMIVIVADMSIIADSIEDSNPNFLKYLKIIKALRIMRVLRLIRANRQLSVLVDSIIIIMPSIANVGSLVMLVIFIFSVIGVNMFSSIIYQEHINENMNFTSFSKALIVLMRCATGESWNKIMKELAIKPDQFIQRVDKDGNNFIEYCMENQSWDDLKEHGPKMCGASSSYFFFGLYIVIMQLMMLNLFIAVVLEGFQQVSQCHTGFINSEHFDDFLDKWKFYDKDASGWIRLDDLVFLVFECDKPLGKKAEFDQNEEFRCMPVVSEVINKNIRTITHNEKNMVVRYKRALAIIEKMRIPVYRNNPSEHFCFFGDVLKRLCKLAILKKSKGTFNSTGISIKLQKEFREAWKLKFPKIMTKKKVDYFDSGKVFAGLFLVTVAKGSLIRKRIRNMTKAINLAELELQVQQQQREKKRKQKALALLKIINGKATQADIKALNESNELSDQDFEIAEIDPIIDPDNTKQIDQLKKDVERREDYEEDPPDRDKDLGFSKFLLADTDFAHELDAVLRKGPVYRKLGMKIMSTVEVEDKVRIQIGTQMLKLIQEINKRKQTKKVKRKRLGIDAPPLDYERSSWWNENIPGHDRMVLWLENQDVRKEFKQLQQKQLNEAELQQIKLQLNGPPQLPEIQQNIEQEQEQEQDKHNFSQIQIVPQKTSLQNFQDLQRQSQQLSEQPKVQNSITNLLQQKMKQNLLGIGTSQATTASSTIQQDPANSITKFPSSNQNPIFNLKSGEKEDKEEKKSEPATKKSNPLLAMFNQKLKQNIGISEEPQSTSQSSPQQCFPTDFKPQDLTQQQNAFGVQYQNKPEPDIESTPQITAPQISKPSPLLSLLTQNLKENQGGGNIKSSTREEKQPEEEQKLEQDIESTSKKLEQESKPNPLMSLLGQKMKENLTVPTARSQDPQQSPKSSIQPRQDQNQANANPLAALNKLQAKQQVSRQIVISDDSSQEAQSIKTSQQNEINQATATPQPQPTKSLLIKAEPSKFNQSTISKPSARGENSQDKGSIDVHSIKKPVVKGILSHDLAEKIRQQMEAHYFKNPQMPTTSEQPEQALSHNQDEQGQFDQIRPTTPALEGTGVRKKRVSFTDFDTADDKQVSRVSNTSKPLVSTLKKKKNYGLATTYIQQNTSQGRGHSHGHSHGKSQDSIHAHGHGQEESD